MGPNGSGKSTLAYVLAGRDGYDVTEGSITFHGKDLLALAPDARAAAGSSSPSSTRSRSPASRHMTFLKTALNAQRKAPRPRRAVDAGLHPEARAKSPRSFR